MPHHKSAIKQHRRSVRQNAVNTSNRSSLRTNIRKMRETIKTNDQEAARQLLPRVFAAIDRAVKKGAIHKNTGSRYKSRLNRQVSLMGPAAGK
jgi:small subunit ribosomal protein S20